MNSKSTKRQQKGRNQNHLIFFGGYHFLVWLIVCLALGWRWLLFGFLVNIVMDLGMLLSWIRQEKKQLYRKGDQQHQNYLIFFGGYHFLVWLIMCLALGWRGILFGFLVNIVMDSGVLLSWIRQEKKQLYRKVDLQQRKNLFVRS